MSEPLEALEVEDECPWDHPEGIRRDAEPHRGPLLSGLARASLVCGIASLFLFLPSGLGLAVGIPALAMCRRDLRRMLAGEMDPQGYGPTRSAHELALAGVALCTLSWIICGLPLAYVVVAAFQ